MAKSDEINGKISSADKAFNDAKDTAKKEKQAVLSIVAGQDEKLNWVELLKFISAAIPQPDGSNWKDQVSPKIRADYWESKPINPAPGQVTGEQAWKEYQRQLAAGAKIAGEKDDSGQSKSAGNDPLGRGIDDRVQF